MDPWQIKRQIAEQILPTITWEDAPQALVLTGGALVSEDEPGDFIPREAFLVDGPVARVSPYAVVHAAPVRYGRRSQAGRIEELRVRVWVVAGAKGITDPTPTADAAAEDTHGANRVTGSLRDPVQGTGKSTGRDVDEITNRIVAALNAGQLIASVHGFQGAIEDPNVIEAVSGVQWLARLIEFVVFDAGTAKYFAPATGPSILIAGAFADLFFTPPVARFDSLPNSLLGLRRGAHVNDPAPTSPTGGVAPGGAVRISAGQFTVNQGIGSGTYNYAYFVPYAETPAGIAAQVPDYYSARITWSATT